MNTGHGITEREREREKERHMYVLARFKIGGRGLK